MFGYLLETLNSLTASPLQVVATGDWRKNHQDKDSAFQRLKNELVSYFWSSYDLSIIPQSEEGSLAAKCAHRYMDLNGFIDDAFDSSTGPDEQRIHNMLFLYVGAGRGSTQITLIDSVGEVVAVFKGPGYPRSGESPVEKLSEICDTIKQDYGDRIVSIFGYDSIYHVLKKNSPVIGDGDKLPEQITTTGADFCELGYLAAHFRDVPMIVFRNFVLFGQARKITFLQGTQPMVDLGTGEAKLVDPSTGVQIKMTQLPSDWATNEESFREVVDIIKTIAC